MDTTQDFYANYLKVEIEDFCAKRHTCTKIFGAIHFLQDQANFWWTTLFGNEKHHCLIVFSDLHFASF